MTWNTAERTFLGGEAAADGDPADAPGPPRLSGLGRARGRGRKPLPPGRHDVLFFLFTAVIVNRAPCHSHGEL